MGLFKALEKGNPTIEYDIQSKTQVYSKNQFYPSVFFLLYVRSNIFQCLNFHLFSYFLLKYTLYKSCSVRNFISQYYNLMEINNFTL